MLCGLGGPHQVENACVAIECARALGLSDEHIRFGVEHAKNPARLEKLSENPTVIYDGAHNPDGVSALDGAARVTIPMPGNYESLNAAQAATVFLFEYVRRITAPAGVLG